MFNQISPTYDRINKILSLGIDRYWRRKVGPFLPRKASIRLLDCATGTGDQIFSLMNYSKKVHQAIGIDLASEMLRIGKKKLREKSYAHQVSFQQASVTHLPFVDESFDCVTISFGIRNFADMPAALQEIRRVIRPAGRLLILEFSLPKNPTFKAAHLYYLRHILPKMGGWLSKDKEAYSYLSQTIETFPYGQNFCSILEKAGFKNIKAHPLTFGVVTLYQGDK